MAVTFKNSGRLTATTPNAPFGGGKFTLSCYVRVNSSPLGIQYFMQVGNVSVAAQQVADKTRYSIRVYTANSTASNGVSAQVHDIRVGVVNHVAVVYDPDDSTRQFLAVNTDKVPLSLTGHPLITFNGVKYGEGTVDDHSIQDAFFLDGYAASDEEIRSLAGGVAAAPGTFTAALVPASRSFYHSLSGTGGTAIQAGAPGVSWAGPPAFNLVPGASKPGGTVTYAGRMESDAALRVVRAYVGSSGRTLTVVMGYPTGDASGASFVAPRGELNAPPTIRLDGGPPIALPTTTATGAYAQPNADAVFLALPPGVAVAPGQSVTLDAPADWFPAAGLVPEVVAHPVANYAGMAVSDGIWPDAKPIRVGTQNEGPTRTTAIRVATNYAKYAQAPGFPRWPDGTLRGYISLFQLLNVGGPTGVDVPGIAGREGIWIIRWDDYDPALPALMGLTDHGDTLQELAEYRNDGDELGRGKVRVYRLDFDRSWNFSLAANIDAAATSIPYAAFPSDLVNYSDSREPYISVGGELIKVGNINAGQKRFENCTRGWNGTTAGPHAAGSTFVFRWGARWTRIYLNSTSAVPADTHYANLGVYEIPESELPTLAPGERFTYPLRDPLEVSKDFSGIMKDGVGVLRYMSETAGMAGDTEHPEQYVRHDAPHFSGAEFVRQFFIKSAGPFDPSVTRYFYTPTPWPGTERYTTTLGSPIATAPPPGTVETISLPNGRADGVIKGQSLFAGAEVMRVLKVPLSGGLYEVERGAVGTATSTHPAGVIQVGYRIPSVAAAQLAGFNGNYYQATIDETVSSPVEFGHVAYRPWAGSDDANLSARRTLKLTAPLSSTSRVIQAAPAEPGDWDFIAKNIRVVIGSETLVATEVDAAAGRISVQSRPSNAASYPAGTTAATKSGGVLLRSPDGTKKAYNNLFNGNPVVLATGVDKMVVVTADEATGLGAKSTAAFAQAFDVPNAKTLPIEFPQPRNHSYEFTALETAGSPGAWHWLNVPWRGTDAAVYAAAKAVRDNLPPGRKVVFELGNELWNGLFVSFAGMAAMGVTCGVPSVVSMYILRTKSAFEVAKRCFAEVGREDELLMSICWQTRQDVLGACRPLGVEPDVVAMAPYLIPKYEWTAHGATFDAIDDDQACDYLTFYMLHFLESGALRSIGSVVKSSLANHEAATGKRPISATYEGGLEKIVGVPADASVGHPRLLRSRDIVHNPNFYFAERDSFAAMREVANVEVYTQLALGGVPSTHFWTMLWGSDQKPGYGDGRNGGVNSRDYSFATPTDLLKGGGGGVRESVRLQAWLDHQRDWRTTNAPGPEPHEPGPNDPGPEPQEPGPNDPGPDLDPPAISVRSPYRFVASRLRPRFR